MFLLLGRTLVERYVFAIEKSEDVNVSKTERKRKNKVIKKKIGYSRISSGVTQLVTNENVDN